MFKFSAWHEHVYKEDLISVLVNGLSAAVLGGILGGAIDYLFSMLNCPVCFGVVLIVYLIAWRVKKAYYSYHVLYPVLSLVFLIVGLWFSYFAFRAIYYIVVIKSWNFFLFLKSGVFWLGFLLEPFDSLILGIETRNMLEITLGTINVIFYVWAFFFTYRWVKGRNR